jgi:hypothetical protein
LAKYSPAVFISSSVIAFENVSMLAAPLRAPVLKSTSWRAM